MFNQNHTHQNIYFFDIGNTNTKWCKKNLTKQITTLSNSNFNQITINNIIEDAQIIVVTTGKSDIAQDIFQHITKLCNKKNILLIQVKTDHSLFQTNYIDEELFGPDRFLNLMGAKSLSRSAFAVISFGTAITLDFYHNKHLGGMILPGLTSSKTLLSEKTGLSAIKSPKTFLGNDTKTSIGAGIYNGYTQLVLGSIYQMERAQKQKFNTFITGGDAHFFQETIAQKNIYLSTKSPITKIDSLLFIGMELYYDLLH